MNIMELGAIGELVGGVAVIASLIYLAVQIRQNTRATYASSYQAFTDSVNDTNRLIAADPELARMHFELGTKAYEEFTDVERTRWMHVMFSFLRSLEALYYRRSQGAAAAQAWRAHSVWISEIAKWPCMRTGWNAEMARWGWDDGFKQYVSEQMARAE